MKISIIMVCLNSAKTIRKALESVRIQTCNDFEMIVIDGVSTDETLQVVAEYHDIVTTIISEKDNGIFDAMNKGVSQAKGDILFFLNSDDAFYDASVLADVVEKFKQDPNIDLLYGNVVPGLENKLTQQIFSHINCHSIEFEHLCHQAVFARRALFEKVGVFNLSFRTNADYDWLIRAFQSGANCAWFNRIISQFSLGGMHSQDPVLLANEHTKVRLQYMTKAELLVGDILGRVKRRWHRHFKIYPLGVAPIRDDNEVVSVILMPNGFQDDYEVGLANGLAKNGVKVTLLGSNTTLVKRLDPSVKFLNLRGSQDPERPPWFKALNLMRYWVLSYGYVLFHRKTPVHMMGMFFGHPYVDIVESWLLRLVSGRYILTIHNILPHDNHTTRYAKANKIVYHAAHKCIVHAPPMRKTLSDDYGVNESITTFIDIGIDKLLPLNLQARQNKRLHYGIKDNEQVILVFGNVLRYKGVDLAINAFNQIAKKRPVRLLIVGRCIYQDIRDELNTMIKSSEYHSLITWDDSFIPDSEVASVFHAADVFVMAYRHIYQSGVIFMALATGLRTVATDVGILKEYIPQGFGRVVPLNDLQALINGIEEVLDEEKPSEKYLEKLAEPYLWTSVVRPLLPVYAELLRK